MMTSREIAKPVLRHSQSIPDQPPFLPVVLGRQRPMAPNLFGGSGMEGADPHKHWRSGDCQRHRASGVVVVNADCRKGVFLRSKSLPFS